MDPIFFNGWESLLRTLIVGVLAYIAMVVLLRWSGNRTLSKMNAFDFVVTIALGSILAAALLNQRVALAQAVVAFALLMGLQYAMTWTSVRLPWFRKAVTGEPHLLLYSGQYLPTAQKRARVTKDEIRAAIREAGLRDVTDAQAVVLETDGSFSVVTGDTDGDADNSSLCDVESPLDHKP